MGKCNSESGYGFVPDSREPQPRKFSGDSASPITPIEAALSVKRESTQLHYLQPGSGRTIGAFSALNELVILWRCYTCHLCEGGKCAHFYQCHWRQVLSTASWKGAT